MKFISQTFKNFKTTGAIMSVRRNTAKKLVNMTSVHTATYVAEFGPGTGKIAEELLKHLPVYGTLFLIECNPEFIKILENKFKHDQRVIIIETYAQDFRTLDFVEFDLVVNSIPMSLLNLNIREAIYNNAFRLLRKGGTFIQYQYTQKCIVDLARCFTKRIIRTEFTWTNIIPTYIFKIQK